MTESKPRFGFPGTIFLGTEDERVSAIVRIGFSAAALFNLMLLWPNRAALFATGGTLDFQATVDRSEIGTVLLFHAFQTPFGVSILMLAVGLALLMLMTGILPRIAAIFVFVWHLSYCERAPVSLAGWDWVLRAFAFLVMVSPMGRWLPTVPRRVASYGLVLMRLQVLAIYFQTVASKLTNADPYWRNGEFLSYFLMSHFARWPATWAAEHTRLLQMGTYLALVAELAIPILLYVRRTRFYGALLGLLLHGSICVVGRNFEPFLLTMIMTYLAFLTTSDVGFLQRWTLRLTARNRQSAET